MLVIDSGSKYVSNSSDTKHETVTKYTESRRETGKFEMIGKNEGNLQNFI
jgi:hypothetical protein